MTDLNMDRSRIPPRLIFYSLVAFAVPLIGAVLLPVGLPEYEVLLWLVALIPAFLFAYYRGWAGVATALAAGMVVLVGIQITVLMLGQPLIEWPLMLAGIAAYIGIGLGIGFLSEELHREREHAQELAVTDDLTGAPNRRYARIFLEKEFAAARRGRPLVVVFFDLDNFKQYNDRHGHAAGDQALSAFANVLLATTRKMNLSARYGGEEFLSVVAASDMDGALIFVDRVREGLKENQPAIGSLTVSAGLAEYRSEMEGVEDLLNEADAALYRAKAQGRDSVAVFGAEDSLLGSADAAASAEGDRPDIVAQPDPGRGAPAG